MLAQAAKRSQNKACRDSVGFLSAGWGNRPPMRYNSLMRSFLRGCCLLLLLLGRWAAAETLTQGPFIIDYHPDDRQAAEDGLRYLVEAKAEFDPYLTLGEEPVTVRVAHNMNEFLGLSGVYAHVGVNGVTRSDKSTIALKSPRLRSIEDDYRGTVRHELVHVLLFRNTDTSRLPRWLNEGICMMLANEIRWQSALQVTRMHLSGGIIPITSLDRAFLAPGSDHQFSDAYAQALSMTRYLRNELGDEKFWAVVRGVRDESFEAAMISQGGLPVQEFWRDFSRGLWGMTLVTTLRTGSFWGAIACLCIVTYLIRRIRNRGTVRRWSEEEDPKEPEVFDWDRILDDAEAWKRQQREEG